MGNSLRAQPMPSRYESLRTPVTEDVLQIGLLYAFGIIAFSFLVIVPGIRGWERVWACIRVFTALWIGGVLLFCNFGSWYADSICTTTQYKAHTTPNSPQLIQATVGISIGLRGINVTLREMENGCGSEIYKRPFPGEQINYVESFLWAPSWKQGRLDFGEFGGQFRQRFREAQNRGMPYPILWVAEKFLFDGEQFVWYRKFRVAGWYTHIFLWLGFATYLFTILLFMVSVRNGTYFLFLTGAMLCLAALTYAVVIRNDPPFQVHFPDAVLRPKLSYSFYVTAVTGVLTCLSACLLMLVHCVHPRRVAAFFHHSVIADDAIFEGILEEEEGDEKEKVEGEEKEKDDEEEEEDDDDDEEEKVADDVESQVYRYRERRKNSQRRQSQRHQRSGANIRGSVRSNRSDIYPRMKSTSSLGLAGKSSSSLSPNKKSTSSLSPSKKSTSSLSPSKKSTASLSQNKKSTSSLGSNLRSTSSLAATNALPLVLEEEEEGEEEEEEEYKKRTGGAVEIKMVALRASSPVDV